MANKNVKKYGVGLVAAIILIGSALLTNCSNRTKLERELLKTAETYNRQAPFMLNERNRFDSLSVILSEPTIQYNITMVDLAKDEVDIEYFDKQIPQVVSQIKASIPPNLIKDKITFVYSYSDKNGSFVHKIAITPDMYSSSQPK